MPDISITDLVKQDLDEQRRKGRVIYGEELRPFNGRDALQDAYEEALDMACYLKQAMIERDTPQPKGEL